MEAALPREESRARGARLRRLHLRGPLSPAPDDAPIASDPSHSTQDARVAESRRPIEQIAHKFPLKVIQNCISRAIKKKPRNGHVKQVAEAPETPPVPSRAASGQSCMPKQPLKEQDPLIGVILAEAADSTAAVTSETMPVLPEEEQMENTDANGYASLTTTMQDWQEMPGKRMVLFLPAVTRPVRSFQDVQDETLCIQKEQLQSAEVDISSHYNPAATTESPGAKSPSPKGGKAPLNPPCEERAACSSQSEEGWKIWKEWLSLQPLLAPASAPQRQAEGENSSPMCAEPYEERGRHSQGKKTLVATTPLRKVPSLFTSQQRSGEEDACCMSPLMIMTPRVADAAPLKEEPYLEVPVHPTSEPQGLQKDGFHASLNIILRLMQKIVAIVEGSSSMLTACSNVASVDEGQLVVDVRGAQASEERSSVKDAITKSDGSADHVGELQMGKQAECEETRDGDRQTVDMMLPEDRRKGDCRELIGMKTQVGPLKRSVQLAQAGTEHAESSCESPAANQEYHYLELSREASGPPPRISSESSCSARGSLAEESAEPSVSVIAARKFRFQKATEGTEETKDDEDDEQVGASTTVLQVTHRAERLATSSVRHLSFSTQVTLTLPSSRTGRTERSRSDSTDLLTILEKQAANQEIFRSQACLLPHSVKPQTSELHSEKAASLVTTHDSEKDSLWKLLREEVEAIPPMHLPAAVKHSLQTPADTNCSVQSVDAAEEDTKNLGTKDLMRFLGPSSASCSTMHQAQTFVNPWQKNAEERWPPLSPLYPIHECEELDAEDEEAGSRLSTRS